MDALSAAETLDLCEACEGLAPVERSLALACGGSRLAVDEIAALPLGRRDAWVLELHGALGGGTLEATVPCAACGEEDEFELEPDALLARARERGERARVEAEGCVVAWRPPDSRDVAAAGEQGSAEAAERVLLSRCVVHATGPAGEEVAGDELPPGTREALAAAMLASDPLAEVLVALVCPACEAAFTAELDVSAFVWSRLRARGQRLLGETHVLARAYGWTQAEVLALGDRRRHAYLELIAQERG
ncbi:MAG TPA: hypothetical protein VG388_03750 [Solirubrobacteraceae bacterium]|jgi:hypothetical protein|nr:hypothetical protein [Solirubrobacteraceae bacterium]